MKKLLNRENLTLALCIALFPPIWAVLAPHLGVQTGAVALICAGVYAAAGNQVKLAVPMSLGFLAGDAWAVLALWVMSLLPFGESLTLFLTLFVMGGLAVIISSLLPKVFYCPAWLCGWAIGLTILAPAGLGAVGTTPWQIGAAMLAGIWYVGVLVEWIHQKLCTGKK
ncbi:MAG: DUF1097 domain-containing protein [Oscillospiraceae bacterium]|nr:DUF1097 domain-containing protein [Oscillospiraceae bacterium]